VITALQENARTLAAALGVAESEAVDRLEGLVLVTVASDAERLARRVEHILGRTLSCVTREFDAMRCPAVEVVVGDARRRSSAPIVGVSARGFVIEIRDREVTGPAISGHPIVEILASCYAAAAAVHRAVQAVDIPLRLPIEFDVAALLGTDVEVLTRPVDLGVAYMAGAGAIGNSVLLGLSTLDVRGELHICDPDTVSAGNLNRCIWFANGDIDSLKAARLTSLAQPQLPGIRLVPHTCALKDVPAASQGGAWLENLIVAVDSRRARRTLQTELPHNVYDASTTGIDEVVLHFNRLPTALACLSCIYYEAPDETAHEAHVAESLGVAVVDVHFGTVTEAAALSIVRRYPDLSPKHLVGLAYDSLFKQLCGQGALKTAADRQVLAPFAFVSVLAGVLLALEFVRRKRTELAERRFNYWRVSPWARPLERTMEIRPKHEDCVLCSDPILQSVVQQVWGGRLV
jgi:hypothetical protein